MNLIPMIGKKFHRLLVLKDAGVNKDRKRLYLCLCDCGITKIITGKSLRNGTTKSCGCYGREARYKAIRKHGHSMTPTYKSWLSMIDRCYNKNSNAYKNYGKRGITVHAKWRKSFSHFLNDMGERPIHCTLDRINGKLGYFPSNCRWATYEQQANNRFTTIKLTAFGKTQTLSQWSKETGIPHKILADRLRKGWTADKCLVYKRRVQSLTFNGTTKTVADWARETGIYYLTIRHRLKRGWSIKDALTIKPN